MREAPRKQSDKIVGAKVGQVAEKDMGAEARALFRVMDKSGDMKLSRSEIKNYMKKEPWVKALLTGGGGFTWQACDARQARILTLTFPSPNCDLALSELITSTDC